MISVNSFRTGMTIEIDNGAWQVLEFQHVKPGKGAAFVRSKIRNVKTGVIQERTFRGGEKVALAHVETATMQYLYAADGQLTFMNTSTYEQCTIPKDKLENECLYLQENMVVQVVDYKGEIIGVQLPTSVTLEVVEADPGIKGDTATGGTKPIKLSTGLVVQAPMFVNVGDSVVVDTRSGSYSSRA